MSPHAIGKYQAHLDRVSRSFAFCIRRLDGTMRHRTSLAYLLFRALDTIEDADFPGPGDESVRQALFGDFESFLAYPPSSAAVAAWVARFPRSVSSGERALLEDSEFLFTDFHELPAGVRADLRDCALRMCGGMRFYGQRRASAGELRLHDLTDVNRYCYFVAGVVGELLTHFMLERTPTPVSERALLKDAFHFGLFLQKINLLKDSRGDEAEKRFLIPDRAELLASLNENARGAWGYLRALPLEEKGYRVFCAWSLFLGAASLPYIEASGKIPRAVTLKILAEVESKIGDHAALKSAFDRLFSELPQGTLNPSLNLNSYRSLASSDSDWFQTLSGSRLEPAELAELRVR